MRIEKDLPDLATGTEIEVVAYVCKLSLLTTLKAPPFKLVEMVTGAIVLSWMLDLDSIFIEQALDFPHVRLAFPQSRLERRPIPAYLDEMPAKTSSHGTGCDSTLL